MTNDSALSGAILNSVFTVIGSIVLGALGYLVKGMRSLIRSKELHSWAIGAIAGHLRDRDQFKFPPRFDGQSGDIDFDS